MVTTNSKSLFNYYLSFSSFGILLMHISLESIYDLAVATGRPLNTVVSILFNDKAVIILKTTE